MFSRRQREAVKTGGLSMAYETLQAARKAGLKDDARLHG